MNCLYVKTMCPVRKFNLFRVISNYYFHSCKWPPKEIKTKMISLRYFHDFEVNSRVQEKYRNWDKVPKNYEIIYRAPMLNYISTSHYISFITGLMVPVATLVFFAGNGILLFPIYLGNLPLFRNLFDFCGFYAGFYFMITQIYVLIRRYPLRVYSDKKGNYVAVYRGYIPWNLENEHFKVGELKKVSSILPWGDSLYSFKSKKAILLEDYFLKPIDLEEMLKRSTDKKE